MEYRRRFNDGFLNLNTSAGYFEHSPQGTSLPTGHSTSTTPGAAGFDVNRASSADFVNDFHLSHGLGIGPQCLTSNIFAEGFGEGAYSRVGTRFYQGLTDQHHQQQAAGRAAALPVQLFRPAGRARRQAVAGYQAVQRDARRRHEHPPRQPDRGMGPAGRPARWASLWTFKLHGDAAAYNASQFNEQPNFGTVSHVDDARALPQAAVDVRWPFARNSGAWGTQLIEPMAEIIVGPNEGGSQLNKYPNEDSLDLEFSDANLFGFNRFGGIDRLQGGSRANIAMHAAWYLGGTALDGLIGQSYNTTTTTWLPSFSGLQDKVSDVVGHLDFTPGNWLDTTYRFRLDHHDLAMRMSDVTASTGYGRYRLTAGYLYTSFDPYYFYDQAQPLPPSSQFFIPRNEITLAANGGWRDYRFDAYAQRDLTNHQMIAIGGDAIYEDECFIMDFKFYRRYTSLNGDSGSTTLLIQLTFKTIGQFGFKAL